MHQRTEHRPRAWIPLASSMEALPKLFSYNHFYSFARLRDNWSCSPGNWSCAPGSRILLLRDSTGLNLHKSEVLNRRATILITVFRFERNVSDPQPYPSNGDTEREAHKNNFRCDEHFYLYSYSQQCRLQRTSTGFITFFMTKEMKISPPLRLSCDLPSVAAT